MSVVGHDALVEALGDLGVGLHDRLADEGRVLALEDLVEIGPDAAGGARRRRACGSRRRRWRRSRLPWVNSALPSTAAAWPPPPRGPPAAGPAPSSS